VSGKRKTASADARDAIATAAMTHLDHLYRVAFHLAKDPAEAEDLVQETVVRALAAYEQFDPGTNMKAWLAKILHNSFVDDYRHKKRWIATTDGMEAEDAIGQSPPDLNSGPESHALRNELTDQVSEALKKLPEEFRIPIVLVDMADLSYEEVSTVLSCPVGTVRSRLSRARKMMQRYLRVYVDAELKEATRK
jgi:RNA polymerase sigma-70 factor (ECF subfamily)